MFDLHIHSHCSHDSRETVENICRCAYEKGLKGVMISDHADMGPCDIPDTYERFCRRADEIQRARALFGDRLAIREGIEMAEYLYDPTLAERLLLITEYDAVLGSVHFVPYDGTSIAYSAIRFDEKSDAWIHGFLELYFEKIKEMIQKTDIDILSHLTCPLRYINGKYGKGISMDAHLPAVREIFSLILSRDIALEVNTSGLDYGASGLMPPLSLLSLYREMGGTRITLGSDAHVASRVGIGFEEVKKHLRDMGFTSCLNYRKREARSIAL